MALVAENVRVGLTGTIKKAPAGTALPVTPTAAVNVGFVDLGYISDAGFEQTQSSSTTKIKAWQNNDIVREIQTEHSLMFHFTSIETNAAVLTAFYGNYATGKVEMNGKQPGVFSWIFEVVDDDQVGVADIIRIVVPRGQLVDRGAVKYAAGEAVGYEMTIECYPDPNYAGTETAPAKAYEYILAVGIS